MTQLKDFLEKNNISFVDFARLIGTSAVNVSRWANGKRIPKDNNMKKIFSATCGVVSANSFYGLTKRKED